MELGSGAFAALDPPRFLSLRLRMPRATNRLRLSRSGETRRAIRCTRQRDDTTDLAQLSSLQFRLQSKPSLLEAQSSFAAGYTVRRLGSKLGVGP